MAFDAFLKLDGIPGESTDSKHKGEIEVLSFSWNIKQSIAREGGGGGGGAGKAEISDFSIVKHIDKSSPVLMVAVCRGEHIRDGTLTVEEPRAAKGGKGEAFMKIKLTDILVSSFLTGGGGTDIPTDQVSLNFSKIEISIRDSMGKWTTGESCDFNKD